MIHDEFTALPLSRQRKKQLRWIRDGKCKICGRKRAKRSAQFCRLHHLRWNEYHRGYMQSYWQAIYAENRSARNSEQRRSTGPAKL